LYLYIPKENEGMNLQFLSSIATKNICVSSLLSGTTAIVVTNFVVGACDVSNIKFQVGVPLSATLTASAATYTFHTASDTWGLYGGMLGTGTQFLQSGRRDGAAQYDLCLQPQGGSLNAPIICGTTCVRTAINCATTCFIGSGAGLTGTAAALTVGNATSAVTATNSDCLDGCHGCYYGSFNTLTQGNNVDYNAIPYDAIPLITIQPLHAPNYTGQTNYPASGYGNILTIGGNTSFSTQISVVQSAYPQEFYFRSTYENGCNPYTYTGCTWWQLARTCNPIFTGTLCTPDIKVAGYESINSAYIGNARLSLNGCFYVAGQTQSVIDIYPPDAKDGCVNLRLENACIDTASPDRCGSQLTFAQRYYTGDAGIIRVGAVRGRKDAGNGAYGGGLDLLYQPNGDVDMLPAIRI